MPSLSPDRSPLRGVARVWLLMLRRRWRQESSIGLVAIAFVWFLFVLGRDRAAADLAVFSTLFLVALMNAVALTVSVGGESLAAARRLALLPLTPRVRFAVRALFGSPLRVPVFAAVLVWGVVHVAAMDLPAGRMALALVQVALLVATGGVLSVLFGAPVAFDWLRAARRLFAVVATSLTILVLVASRMTMDIGLGAMGYGVTATLLCAAAAVTLCAAAYRWSAAPPALPSGVGGRASRFARATDVLPPPLRKETLLLLRMVGLRLAILLSIAASSLAFAVGMPWFLFALPIIWFNFFLNGLGADLPGGGVIRYHVAAIELRRVLAWRHAAVLLVVTACVALAALAIAATTGIARPVAGASRWSYLSVFAYAAAMLLVSAVPASRIALRYPLARNRLAWSSGPDNSGPAALMLWALAAAALVVMCAVAAFILGSLALHAIAPPSVGLASNTLVAAALAAAGYALAIHRRWHAPA